MDNLFQQNAVYGVRIVSLDLMFTPAPQPWSANHQTRIGEKEFKAFVETYVQIQNIRLAYEPLLKRIHNPEETRRIRQEMNTKAEITLEKEGLGLKSYNSIFTAVNANDELRTRALLLIDKQRRTSHSKALI